MTPSSGWRVAYYMTIKMSSFKLSMQYKKPFLYVIASDPPAGGERGNLKHQKIALSFLLAMTGINWGNDSL